MIARLTSIVCFAVLVLIGNVLLFIQPASYWLIPVFFICMLFVPFVYHTTKPSPIRCLDFVVSGIISIVCLIVLQELHMPLSIDVCSYIYLVTFLSVVLYADSVRFKSLL